MAQNTDINDIRRQQKRLRLIKQLCIALFVVLAIIFIYANRAKWFPKLEGIGSKYEDAFEDDGDFPISVSSGGRYNMESCGDSIVVLGNTSFKVYSQRGALTANFQHAYTSPVVQTSSKRILVYDSGGVKFRVDAPDKSIYEKTMDDNILLARISEEGYAAVVTTSDMYVCVLYVYDDKGKNIYTRGCTDKITDITFDNESNACYATYMDASGGQLLSKIKYFEFTADSQNADGDFGVTSSTLALETTVFEDGGYAIIGDNMTIYYNADKSVDKIYSYDDTLIDFYADASGKTALLFENTDMRCCNLVLMQKGSTDIKTISLAQGTKCLACENNKVFICVDGAVMSYNYDGTLSKSMGTQVKCSDIVVIGDYIYLLGYDTIEQIDSVLSGN